MALHFRVPALAGALAATTILTAPAAAAPATGPGTPAAMFDASRYDPAAATADWRCRGWGCGWGGYRRGWRRNRVDAGDVLIGAAIIGGIAAIASSANRRQRERDVVIVEREVRDPDHRYDDRRDADRRAGPRGAGASGLDNAVNQCLDRIERDVRVDTVDDVERTASGWQVSGRLFNGSPFSCRIGNGGQIDTIDYGNGFSAAPAATYSDRADGQWSDQRYADARLALGGMAQPQATAPAQAAADMPLPAYPGGPIPGEEIPETIDGSL